MDPEQGILAGIRVLEVATYVFGPGAATVMADFGAEVIKVERPRFGDPYRYLSSVPPMPSATLNYCWLLDGRNKKSLALDLTSSAGRDILLKLAATADVFITNYQPAVLAKFQLAYEDLSPLNERLIYAQASGYGETGAEVEKPGYDMTAYWARSGLMDSIHNGDGEPCLAVAGMGDHPSAMTLFGGIMLALYARQRTGRGTKVSTSLLANGAWANSCLLQAALVSARTYVRASRATAFNPLINHYVTRDHKRFLFCLIQADHDWPRLCRALGHPEWLEDSRFATQAARGEHSADLIARIDEAVAGNDMAAWADIFAEHQLAWSPVATNEEAAHDAQMVATGIFVDVEHPRHGRLRTISSPLFLQGNVKVPPRPAPAIGQHTVEVLQMLGYSKEAIQHLLEQGAIATARSD